MRFRLISTLVILTIAVVTLTSCFGAKYLMPGLKLPPGSTVISTVTDDGNSIPDMLGRKPEKAVMVEFNCPGGWSTVTGHFDSFMQGKGYSDPMKSIADKTGLQLPDISALGLDEMMRSYSKEGASYTVIVSNEKGMGGNVGADFSLTVIKLKN